MADIQKNYTTGKGVEIKLHENKMFSVFFNGNYHYIEFNSSNIGAVVIPRFSNGDFLLVELLRAPSFGMSTEFPRGGVNPKESPQAGAIRELKEETGYAVDVESLTFLGMMGPDTATLNGSNYVFIADIQENIIQQGYNTDEITQVIRVTPEELRTLIRTRKIFDGQTLAAYGLLQSWA